MFIMLHCAGMPFNGSTIHESSLGGSETAAYYIAKGLASRGHRVTVFTNHPTEGEWDGVKYSYTGEVNEQFPLGNRFMFYAMHTPCDVLIMQRHPYAFRYKWASKVNIWWLHDLALKRGLDDASSMMWNIDTVFSVSEWHKKQIEEVWKVPAKGIRSITNGVDLELWREPGILPFSFDEDQPKKLLYAARPERGFENLVGQDGIMDKLLKEDPDIHLYYCAYANTVPQMVEAYAHLEARANVLPNCTNLGSLTKKQLADVESKCEMYVYPTTFEDTSCIMAMECAAAGLPFFTSPTAAVPETVGNEGGTIFIPLKAEKVDTDKWVETILHTFKHPKKLERLSEKQLEKAPRYSWENTVSLITGHIRDLFEESQENKVSMVRHFIGMSDYYAAIKYAGEHVEELKGELYEGVRKELEECYQFVRDRTWRDHYEAYYKYEAERGVVYGPEDLSNNSRYDTVSGIVGTLLDSCNVLDYGCAHGHYTINLAKKFPNLNFIGCDIAQSNIDSAEEWAKSEGITNVQFLCGEVADFEEFLRKEGIALNAAIVAELLEHVEKPWALLDDIMILCEQGSKIILTTPYGAWEEQGYKEHHPWRAHVHHLERADVHELWGSFPEFNLLCVPSGNNTRGEALGSYVTSFNVDHMVESGSIDYDRKFACTVPRQSVSLCMIVHDAEETLKRALEKLRGSVDEIIIGLDKTTTDRTARVITDFVSDTKLWPMVKVIDIDSPLETGFDEARNTVIAEATGDWIMWIDSDEIVVHAEHIFKYLRSNMYDGYAMKQHHFAVEPLGVIKTDIPARLFRNNIGVRFFGVVHEHPETEINKGIGVSMLIPDIEIAHEGYTTNEVRRKRFDRNISLMVRDREKYPDRLLGKFLWLRDLSQMCTHELADNGGQITDGMKERAKVGLKLWEELLEQKELRMLLDGMEFYNILAAVNGPAFSMGFMFDLLPAHMTVNLDNGARRFEAKFASQEHAICLLKTLVEERVKEHECKYL